MFFVPATINYLLTLEAETLVDDFLRGGQAPLHHRGRRVDAARAHRRLHAQAAGLDAGCVIRFGAPLDCFGNAVDEDAVSHDARGHVVDPLSYLADADGKVGHDPARDAQYTRELGEAIVRAYQKDTVAMATHLVAACAFEKMQERLAGGDAGHPADIFAMLRAEGRRARVRAPSWPTGSSACATAPGSSRARARIVLGPRLARASGRDILDEALRAFSGYHTSPVLEPRGIRCCSSTRGSSSTTRTVSRATGWPPISSRPSAKVNRPVLRYALAPLIPASS